MSCFTRESRKDRQKTDDVTTSQGELAKDPGSEASNLGIELDRTDLKNYEGRQREADGHDKIKKLILAETSKKWKGGGENW